jgi:hypothetical protein
LTRVRQRDGFSRNAYVEYRFNTDVRMLPQSGPLEGKAADTRDMLLGLKAEASAPASRQQSRLKDKP